MLANRGAFDAVPAEVSANTALIAHAVAGRYQTTIVDAIPSGANPSLGAHWGEQHSKIGPVYRSRSRARRNRLEVGDAGEGGGVDVFRCALIVQLRLGGATAMLCPYCSCEACARSRPLTRVHVCMRRCRRLGARCWVLWTGLQHDRGIRLGNVCLLISSWIFEGSRISETTVVVTHVPNVMETCSHVRTQCRHVRPLLRRKLKEHW